MQSKKSTLTIFSITLLAILTTQIANIGIWRDEVFTLQLLEHTKENIVALTAQDVHPPLYYLLAKPFQLLANGNLFLEIRFLRFFSILPILAIVAVLYRYLREKGLETKKAYLLSILFLLMPHVLLSATDMRMYGFSQLFLLLSFISMQKFLEEKRVKSLVAASFFALLCLYTNYFAGLAAGGVFLYAMLVFLMSKSYRQILQIIAFGVGIGVLYFPWLLILISQLKAVHEDFWMQSMGLRDIILSFMYLFSSADGNVPHLLSFVLLFVSALLLAVLAVQLWRGKKLQMLLEKEIAFGLFVPAFVLLVGLSVSFLFRPVFLPRYLLVSAPVAYLSLVEIGRKLSSRTFKTMAIVFFGISLIYSAGIDLVQLKNSSVIEEMSTQLASTAVLADKSDNSGRLASVYSEIVYEQEADSYIQKQFEPYENQIASRQDLPESFYYFHQKANTQELDLEGYAKTEEFSIRLNSEGSYLYTKYERVKG